MSIFLTPAEKKLVVPGSGRRVLRRPDLRNLVVPRLSGEPLRANEVDFDDLVIHRTWRSYDPKRPSEVRYFMFELSQKNPGESEFSPIFFKAMRMVRLTRVPRYLRQATAASGPNMVFEQMRDVLAALREQGVLFTHLIAKNAQSPLIFAYGVQGVGSTPEEAQALADEGHAVLTAQLDGTYQQLKYAPITLEEGEGLARNQAEWEHLAMGRGRPLPTGGTVGSASILDGNRTDVESINNQLESFLRGMSDKEFMLSLVTVPLSPAEITVAWRNITQELSKVRSEVQGQRSVNAGVAFPLTMGHSAGEANGNTHSTGLGTATSLSDGTSASLASSEGLSQSQGVNSSVGSSYQNGVSQSISDSTTQSYSEGQSLSVGASTSQGDSLSMGDSYSNSASMGSGQSLSLGDTISTTDGVSESLSLGQSQSLTESQGLSNSASISEGQSLTQGQSVGSNWANSVGQSLTGSLTNSQGWSQSQADALSQSISNTATNGSSLSGGVSSSNAGGLNGQIPLIGLGGSTTNTLGEQLSTALSNSNAFGLSQSGSSTNTTGVNSTQSSGLSQGVNLGESFGGSFGQSASASNSVGASQTIGTSQGLSATNGATLSQGQGVSSSISQGQTLGQGLNQSASQGVSQGQSLTQGTSQGTGQSLSQGQSTSQGVSQGRTASMGESQSFGQSASQGQSASVGQSQSLTQTDGTSRGVAANQSLTDSYAIAMSRTNANSGSLAVAPSFGVSISKATFDEGKRFIGDILEAQMRRYSEGIKSGAFLYQMFLVCPDRETLLGASGLLKSAFWGAGASSDQLPQPFHTIVDFEDDERQRLLSHASAFTSYRKREPQVEMIEPFLYSSYLTPTEAAAFVHPPVTEGPGLLAVHDSMPVLRMPSDRRHREIHLGHLVNGERAEISDWAFGIDLDEMTHTLIAGVTGSGKTTTLMRFLSEAVKIERSVVVPSKTPGGIPETKKIKASILGLDWMRSMRDLASMPELAGSDRFRFYSFLRPELGAFRWNLLEVPANGMPAVEWLNAQADNFTASFNLGEYGRSLIAEFLTELYSANRLEDFVLMPEIMDGAGQLLRPAIVLPAIDPSTLPPGSIRIGPDGKSLVNVISCPALSRCVSMAHLATMVAAKVELLATPEAARLYGPAMRDRLQSLWRRMQYFAPGGQYSELLGCDDDLETRTTLSVMDLVNPDEGLITILETDGLDLESRRLILGSVMLALYKYGLHHGEGIFDHDHNGPGAFVVMEESHELFGVAGKNEDAYSASTRTELYESMFRRVRQLGMRLVAVAQQPATLPEAVTANMNNVFIHKIRAAEDRDKAFSMLNWSNQIGQHQREWRYLGELPVGYCIARLDAKDDYLESAPVQFKVDPPNLAKVGDAQLKALAQKRK